MEPESRDPVRDGRALREMAQLASAPATSLPPKKPNADHSGLVDLAALMADQPNWLDGAVSRAKSSAGFTLAPPSVGPSSIAPTMRELSVDSRRAVSRSRSLLILTSTFAGLLVAGACVFALRLTRPVAPAAPAPAPVLGAAYVEPGIPAPGGDRAALRADSPSVAPPPATGPAAPPTEPGAAQATAADSESAPPGHHGRRARREARVAEARFAPVAVAAPVAKEAEAPSARQGAPPPPHVGSALDSALRAAAGPIAAAPVAAAPAPAPAAPKAAPPPVMDGRPERPSGSAVTSALNAALTGARKCVASMTDASRALVTFGSDGAVHKVDVSGPASSDPRASSCLRTAFGRARISPFSASTYAAGVTVRPE